MKINRTKDYNLIAKLNEGVHRVHAQLFPEFFKEYNAEEISLVFQELVNHEKNIFLVLEDTDSVIGYAWVEVKNFPENPFKKSYKTVYIHQISINENVRGKGFGTALMNEIYGIARKENISLVELDYWSGNANAKEFYKKEGFEVYREFVFKRV